MQTKDLNVGAGGWGVGNVPKCAKVGQKCVLKTTGYITAETKNSQLKQPALETSMTQSTEKRSLFSKY